LAVRRFSLAALQKHGYRTVEAHDGSSGLTAFLRHKDEIDIVVTDILMPEVTGPEMVEKITKVEPSVKVVFITGTPQHTTLRPFKGKHYEVLLKPFTPAQLATCVRKCLQSCA
jgi:two-component system cell cycle sensor histidine kinase/response regulator CckA